MRVALVTPVALPTVRGNAVTVSRLQQGLAARGVEAPVIDLSRTASASSRLAALAPDVVHAFHAFRGAPAAVPHAEALGAPLVITLTGTDANHDLFHPERRATTIASIRAARALVVFHETIRERVARDVPEAADRIDVIPQSVALGDEPYAGPAPPAGAPDEVRFLLPAGIREVKNVLFPLGPLRTLAARHPVRLLIAGPVIEPREGARLAAALASEAWATYLGPVPHPQMGSLLDQVDVVVNSSLSEGGMANSVLEAMARGRPVLASDIEGNRSVIEPEVDGLLFRDAAEFERAAERLVRDAGLRRRLGVAARAKVSRLYPPEREITAHVELYRRLLAGGRRPGGRRRARDARMPPAS
ncbi:MAG: glycosyltransferase [Candidatus Rokuibacteriota bacterium]